MFYVYEWFIIQTGEVIYVGKGCKNRYKVRKHNYMFDEFVKRFDCDSRIVKEFETEDKAFEGELERIAELKAIGQCVCNINTGGKGGLSEHWTAEKRKKYSENNVMKSQEQRTRMSINNPMKNPVVAEKVAKTKRKPVLVDGKYFDSVTSAAEYIGTWDVYLSKCLKDKNGMCKGHKCEYGNQQPSHTKSDNSSVEGSTTNG